ncbi:MAG TPA: outer membrane beta-barrel protein, partial [bacterium]|nr:outer membrane beta-barrel protein [bacterium]
LGLQPEVMYEQKGGQINGNPIQLGYLEVPVLLDIKLIGPLGIIAGPSFELNTDSNGIQNVNSADVGLVAGAQVNLSRILLSGRYEVGLSDVSSSQKVQNGLFTFLVGLSLL